MQFECEKFGFELSLENVILTKSYGEFVINQVKRGVP